MLRTLIVLGLLGAAHPAAGAVAVPEHFQNSIMLTGLTGPVGMAFLPDGRLFVVELNTSQIKVWTGGVFATPLVTVPHVRSGGERGLLGIAIDPRWPAKPYVYVHYNHYDYPDSDVRISRYTVTGDLRFTGSGALQIDAATQFEVLTGIRDAAMYHNGGTLRFGPDAMLYASFGDDGDGCAAQDTTNLGGKIVRLDIRALPDGPGGPMPLSLITPSDNPFVSAAEPRARLVYALGLRNPFRFHIDPVTGDAFIADVGNEAYEEIDYIPAGGGGRDFGWPWYEGFAPFGNCPSGASAGFTDPIHVYDHSVGETVISAGPYRPRGAASFPDTYDGDYFYADYFSGDLTRLKRVGTSWVIPPPVAGQPAPTAWGTGFASGSDWTVGPDGALWWCDVFNGRIQRIAYQDPAPPPGPPSAEKGPFYDLQGRRVQKPELPGLYFSRGAKRRVVLR